MNLKQEIGERIHELQRKSGKSIELWSLEYGINVNKFYSYKYGRAEPDSNFYKKLAENGVDMFWLFTGVEPNSNGPTLSKTLYTLSARTVNARKLRY